MLSAKKKALQATLTQDVVALQNTELEFFYSNFGAINTMSAVIGGFAFSGLIVGTSYTGYFVDASEGSKYAAIQCFYAFASLSIGFCMLTCIMCTLLNVRGPGLALRGPEGSLKKAVDLMRGYQRHVNTTLTFGLIAFHLEALTYSWIMLSRILTVLLVSFVLIFFLAQMLLYIRSILRDFRIPSDFIVEGGLAVEDLVSVSKTTGTHGGSYQAPGGGGPAAADVDEVKLADVEKPPDAAGPAAAPLIRRGSQDRVAAVAADPQQYTPSIFKLFFN